MGKGLTARLVFASADRGPRSVEPSSLWGSVMLVICPCRINTPQVGPGSKERKVVTRRAEFDFSIVERKPKDSGEDDPSEGDLGAGNWLFPGKWDLSRTT